MIHGLKLAPCVERELEKIDGQFEIVWKKSHVFVRINGTLVLVRGKGVKQDKLRNDLNCRANIRKALKGMKV